MTEILTQSKKNLKHSVKIGWAGTQNQFMSWKSFPICYEDCVSEPSLREFGIRRYKKSRMFYLSSHEFKLLPSLVELLRLDSLWVMFADWSWGWHGCWSLDLDWQLSLQSPLHFICIILSLSFTHNSNTFHVTSHLKSIWIICCLWSYSVPISTYHFFHFSFRS